MSWRTYFWIWTSSTICKLNPEEKSDILMINLKSWERLIDESLFKGPAIEIVFASLINGEISIEGFESFGLIIWSDSKSILIKVYKMIKVDSIHLLKILHDLY